MLHLPLLHWHLLGAVAKMQSYPVSDPRSVLRHRQFTEPHFMSTVVNGFFVRDDFCCCSLIVLWQSPLEDSTDMTPSNIHDNIQRNSPNPGQNDDFIILSRTLWCHRQPWSFWGFVMYVFYVALHKADWCGV